MLRTDVQKCWREPAQNRFSWSCQNKERCCAAQTPDCHFSNDLQAAQAGQVKFGTQLSSGPCFRGEKVSAHFTEDRSSPVGCCVLLPSTLLFPAPSLLQTDLVYASLNVKTKVQTRWLDTRAALSYFCHSLCHMLIFSGSVKIPLQWSHLIV